MLQWTLVGMVDCTSGELAAGSIKGSSEGTGSRQNKGLRGPKRRPPHENVVEMIASTSFCLSVKSVEV